MNARAIRILALFCVLAAGGLPLLGGEPDSDLLRSIPGLEPEQVGGTLRLLALGGVLAVVPGIVLLATCYPRILIVLSFLRRALGTQDLPSNQVLAGLTLLLTILVMSPLAKRVHDEAYLPYKKGELANGEEAVAKAGAIVKRFLLAHTLDGDLRLFVELTDSAGRPAGAPASTGAADPTRATTVGASEPTVEDLGFFVVLPAFVLSELKVAFQMGFLLYLPFLVIDLVVSAVLVSMGMFLLPPVLVSLPLKVLVFVLADGWNMVVGQLVNSFRVLA